MIEARYSRVSLQRFSKAEDEDPKGISPKPKPVWAGRSWGPEKYSGDCRNKMRSAIDQLLSLKDWRPEHKASADLFYRMKGCKQND